MWIGLRADDATVNCNSMATCAATGKVKYHRPGATSDAADDIEWAFTDETWLDGPIQIASGGNALCTMMSYADDSANDNNKVHTVN